MSSVEFDEEVSQAASRQALPLQSAQNPHPVLGAVGLSTPRRLHIFSLVFVIFSFVVSAYLFFMFNNQGSSDDFLERYGTSDQSGFSSQQKQ
ncbi:MAG: hypothetical protein V4519_01565 [Patescibacteria group bacterium]